MSRFFFWGAYGSLPDAAIWWCLRTGVGAFDQGFPIVASWKQKLNTKSSTESELVGIDDMMPIMLWTCYFLLSQGYGIVEILLLQDNKSLILVEQNGKASSSKHTRHINIRYFFITDWVNMKEISIGWCPTKKMVADFMTKPLQGSHFKNLRDYIMSRVRSTKHKHNVISVGKKTNKAVTKKSKVNGKSCIKMTGSKHRVKLLAQ
jgi:hypothetical protein